MDGLEQAGAMGGRGTDPPTSKQNDPDNLRLLPMFVFLLKLKTRWPFLVVVFVSFFLSVLFSA